MDHIIENYIIIPGLIGLILIIALKIHVFNSYKKIKQKLDPNFNPLDHQGWVGNTFFMNLYMLQEEKTSTVFNKIIKRHNKLLRILIIYMISFCCIVILFAALNAIFF